MTAAVNDRRGSPVAQVRRALTMLTTHAGSIVDGDRLATVLAMVDQIRSLTLSDVLDVSAPAAVGRSTPSREPRLGPAERRVLDYLRENGPIRNGSGRATPILGAALDMSTGSLTDVLARLARKHLITRRIEGRRTFEIARRARRSARPGMSASSSAEFALLTEVREERLEQSRTRTAAPTTPPARAFPSAVVEVLDEIDVDDNRPVAERVADRRESAYAAGRTY